MAYTAAKDETLNRPVQDTRSNTKNTDDGLTVMAHRAGQKLSGIIGGTYKEVSGTAEAVTREIRNRPVQSSLIALGAGYVLAALFRR